MKKVMICFVAFALTVGVGCSSTDTSTETASTAETTPSTEATADLSGPGGRVGEEAITPENMSDPMFLIDAASSGLMEVQLGKMVVQNAASAEVKKFAQMMIDDHTKANEELQAVAAQLNVTLSNVINKTHQAMIDKLTGKTGAALEEEYMDLMETAHKMDIAKFEVKSASAQNQAVKDFATKTLPVLRSHLEMASSIEDTVD